jgi:hypothetical protein
MTAGKFVYFDASAGASGDMILAALLDLGVDRELFREKVARLRLPVEVSTARVRRAGLRALRVDVRVAGRNGRPRTFADVARVIGRSGFSTAVKDRALAVFHRLFEAEARVHGTSFRTAHLHEAGADDALVDILGASYLLEALDVSEILASPLNLGSGSVRTAHGVLPVPAPATAELLKGVPVYSAYADAELVTPTGAAILAATVRKFVKFPELAYQRIGRGAGARDFPGFPNVLRAFYGDVRAVAPDRRLFVVESVVDDAQPQLLAHFLDRALAAGALDVNLAPVVMKKNRLGTKLTVLAGAENLDGLIELVFRETTSLGVRYYPVERRVLERKYETIAVPGGRVRLKLGLLDGRVVNVGPEYEDCLKAASASGRPLKEIMELAAKKRRGPR